MAILNHDKRPIVVDGVLFRWRVGSRPTYSQDECKSSVVLSVVSDVVGSPTLIVDLPNSHPGEFLGELAVPVLPSQVATYIRSAVQSGWKPKKKGRPFILHPY
jgi:hypothetical protein